MRQQKWKQQECNTNTKSMQNIARRIFLTGDLMNIFIFLMRATCPAHGILFNFIDLIILSEEYTIITLLPITVAARSKA
jgi:hypothetical protein